MNNLFSYRGRRGDGPEKQLFIVSDLRQNQQISELFTSYAPPPRPPSCEAASTCFFYPRLYLKCGEGSVSAAFTLTFTTVLCLLAGGERPWGLEAWWDLSVRCKD